MQMTNLPAAFAAIAVALASAAWIHAADTEPEKFAAEELRHWLGEISESPVEETFRVGTEHLDLFPEDKAALDGTDGFAVRRRDGAIYITSPQPRGVIYGVYALLERNTDMIFPRPDSKPVFTRVPKLQIRDADFRERPKFDLCRGWWICGPMYHADHQTICSCALCKANPDSVSTRFFKYLNEMMKEVRAVYPDTIATTFGYQITAEPPAVKVDDHVLVSFCPYVKDDKHSILEPENEKWKLRADKWVSG